MPGHVNKVQLEIVVEKLGETEIDGDSTFTLLWQPIAVGSREGLDQTRLAVIDVTRSTPYNMPHGVMVHGRGQSVFLISFLLRPRIQGQMKLDGTCGMSKLF